MWRHDFSERTRPADLLEWMDGEDVDEQTFRECVKSLARVNVVSLGHRPSVAFALAAARRIDRPLRLLDVGSGYGDTLRAIARALQRQNLSAELVGADLNPHATAVAQAASEPAYGKVNLTFHTADARDLAVEAEPFDVIISALFTHHLDNDEVVEFILGMEAQTKVGWFVNDLFRSKFAAVGFGALATVAAQHPFVRHDGPVSFARAFRRSDWVRLLSAAGIPAEDVEIAIPVPFRMCLTRWHD